MRRSVRTPAHGESVSVPRLAPHAKARSANEELRATERLEALDDAAHGYVQAAEQLRNLTARANRYYEQGDYKDDHMALGRELHRPLLAAFQAFEARTADLASALDAVAKELARWYRQSGPNSETADAYITGEEAARAISTLGNVDWPKLSNVDRPGLRAALGRYQSLLDALGYANDSQQLSFLSAAKELVRRAEHSNWTQGERIHLARSGSQWMIPGSPRAMLYQYNRLESLFEPIARRYEVPVALSIDPF